jgi:REP element-mobilizing transposase RayT
MNHGDRRELISIDDADRQRFVDTLGEVCAKTGWQVRAYVLMPNHFDWVVETPQPNRVAGMKWLLGTDTSRFNRRHKLFGHLFSGRYKSLIVGGSGSGYLKKRGRLRPFESGASETGGSGCALAEFCLEQLAGAPARALETSGVVAGGSVAGRVGHARGQSGGAATA